MFRKITELFGVLFRCCFVDLSLLILISLFPLCVFSAEESGNETLEIKKFFLHEIKVLESKSSSLDFKNPVKSEIVDDMQKLSVDDYLSKVRRIQIFLVYDQDIGKNNFRKTGLKHNDKFELYLALLKTIRNLIDPEFKPSYNLSMVVRPPIIKGEKVPPIMFAGMPVDAIESPKVREEYLKLRAENSRKLQYHYIQTTLSKLYNETQSAFVEFALDAFKRKSSGDDIVINLLTTYEYPETERVKLLADLNIPYKCFRNWESTDKLFKATARFISLDKDEVNLEKADGKKTTIELSVLRKEDQDYVKKQLESEKKTVDDEKAKKD
jgi:hypothetical protein